MTNINNNYLVMKFAYQITLLFFIWMNCLC